MFYACCTNNLYDVIYSSWDIEYDRLKLAIMGHFSPFTLPPKKPKNQNFEKMIKIAGDIIILYKCTKNHNHIWGTVHEIWSETDRIFCHFGTFFAFIPHPLTTRKIKFSKQWKKHLEMSSLYTCVPQKSQLYDDICFLRHGIRQT